MYVVCDNSRIVGCGAIAGYWGSLTESILLTIFVLPDYQGKGIGRRIIETLEQDEYFPTLGEIAGYLRKELRDGDMLIVMGAGDVIKLDDILLENKS